MQQQQLDPLQFNVILEHNWDLENNKIDIFLIRHGFSKANKAKINGFNQQQKNYVSALDINLMDCCLDEWGRIQAQNLANSANKLDIKVVFVSPLRRTLETAHLIFGNHKNRKNIKFIVLPLISESLCEVDDISRGKFDELYAEFNNKNEIFHDFTYFYNCLKTKDNWFIENFQDEEKKQYFYTQEKQALEQGKTFTLQELILNEMKRIYPQKLETWPEIYVRASKAKQFIKNYIYKENLQKQGSVCMVAHHEILMGFTNPIVKDVNLQQEKNQQQEMHNKFQQGVNMDNCQVYGFNFDDIDDQ